MALLVVLIILVTAWAFSEPVAGRSSHERARITWTPGIGWHAYTIRE